MSLKKHLAYLAECRSFQYGNYKKIVLARTPLLQFLLQFILPIICNIFCNREKFITSGYLLFNTLSKFQSVILINFVGK